MSERIKLYTRGPQMVRALYDYGPLNREVLCDILKPPISKRKANQCLQKLKDNGLVLNCSQTGKGYAEHYYQLARNRFVKAEIAKMTGFPAQSLNIPSFRGSDHLHSVNCAYWSEYLKRQFQEALVVRDFHVPCYPEIMKKLVITEGLDLYPDIVVSLKNADGSGFVTFAVEIEKSEKARKRIFRKLNKFASRSYIDGAIYLCPTQSLIDVIGGVYSNRIRDTARRIRQYGNFFLMFTHIETPDFDAPVTLRTVKNEKVLLSDWTGILCKTKWQKRRNEQFHVRPPLA